MKTLFVCPLIALFTLLCFQGSTQTLIYDVYKGDKSIGIMKAHRTQKDAHTTQYLIETEVKFRILKEFVVNSSFESTFHKKQLTHAKTLNLLNGKERESSRVTWDGTQYVCEREGEQVILKAPITYSVANLYFAEPTLHESTFSERFIESCKISKGEEDAAYFLHLPNGKENRYTYENGICKEVEVDLFLATIYFKLRDASSEQVLNKKF